MFGMQGVDPQKIIEEGSFWKCVEAEWLPWFCIDTESQLLEALFKAKLNMRPYLSIYLDVKRKPHCPTYRLYLMAFPKKFIKLKDRCTLRVQHTVAPASSGGGFSSAYAARNDFESITSFLMPRWPRLSNRKLVKTGCLREKHRFTAASAINAVTSEAVVTANRDSNISYEIKRKGPVNLHLKRIHKRQRTVY